MKRKEGSDPNLPLEVECDLLRFAQEHLEEAKFFVRKDVKQPHLALKIYDAARWFGVSVSTVDCDNNAVRVNAAVEKAISTKSTSEFKNPEMLKLKAGEVAFYLHFDPYYQEAIVSLGIVEEPSPLRIKTLPVLHFTRNHIRVYVGNYREVEPTIYYPDPKEVSITRFTGNVST